MFSRCRNQSASSSAVVVANHQKTSRLQLKYRFFFSHSATFHQSSQPVSEYEQSQNQQQDSAMFTVWNLVADLVDSGDLHGNEQQQQIIDFYAKAGTTFPRLACLMQLYFHATDILHRVSETVVFVEGDNNELSINDNFLTRAENLIKSDYYKYDKTYLSGDETVQAAMEPMIIVEKAAVISAWRWYEHHLNIATKIFTIDYNFCGQSISRSSLSLSRQKTLKQSIMLFDFNIFPVSAITDKHPATGQTYVYPASYRSRYGFEFFFAVELSKIDQPWVKGLCRN